jgi:hypothetical protein
LRPFLENIEEDKGLRIRMILVDANIGVVRGMREVELTPGLSRKLVEEARKQSEKGFDKDSYYMKLAKVNSVLDKATAIFL